MAQQQRAADELKARLHEADERQAADAVSDQFGAWLAAIESYASVEAQKKTSHGAMVEAADEALSQCSQIQADQRQAQAEEREREHQATEEMNAALSHAEVSAQHLDRLPTPVMTVDKDYSVTFINPAGAGVLGVRPEECMGRKCYELFKTPHCRTEQCACHQAMSTGERVTSETVADPNGLNLPIMYTGAPIKDATGQIVGALEYVVDVTDIKAARDQAAKIAAYQESEVASLNQILEKVSAGELTATYSVAAGDEDTKGVHTAFAGVAASLNSTLANLGSILGNIKRNAEALATDISKDVLAYAAAGRYTDMEVRRGVSPQRLAKSFDPSGAAWCVNERLRSIVEFRQANLAGSFVGLGNFDVIFCRNVIIYFDVQTKIKALSQMERMLNENGQLLVGATETTYGLTDALETVRCGETILYQKRTMRAAGNLASAAG